jgi:hypothetical protein
MKNSEIESMIQNGTPENTGNQEPWTEVTLHAPNTLHVMGCINGYNVKSATAQVKNPETVNRPADYSSTYTSEIDRRQHTSQIWRLTDDEIKNLEIQ